MNLKAFIKKIIYKSTLFEKVYQKDEFIRSFSRYKLDDNKTNNILGWIPYVKGKTKIAVYNFLSTNYSIRSDLKFNIYLIDQLKIVKKLSIDLKPDEIKEINLNENFNDLDGQIIIGQLVSEKIKNKHGGNDGHFRFWGAYNNSEGLCFCIVHSMALSNDDLFLRKDNYSRNYNLNENKNYFTRNIFSSGTQLIQGTDNFKKVFYGFNLINDKNKNPHTIWHLAPINKRKNDKKKILQGAYCPNIDGLDPYIILDPKETGIKNNILKFYILRNNMIVEKKNLEIHNFFKLKVSEIFEKKISPDYFIFMEFESFGLSHSHIQYTINEKICDQVHMHENNWEIRNNMFLPIETIKKNNCRKFFFFDFNNNNQQNLIIIHNEKIKNKENKIIKVRLFSNNNFERLNSIEVGSSYPIIVKNIKDLFNVKDIKFGIIQIESFDYNFHATGLSYDNKSKYILTDHFTGG